VALAGAVLAVFLLPGAAAAAVVPEAVLAESEV
jgi:hypothetical protein